MPRIPTDSFLKFCKSHEGERISTLNRGRQFTLRVIDDGLEFTPLSTNKPRRHTRPYVESVLDHFEQSGSFNPKHYQKSTANASYQLALIHQYCNSLRSLSSCK